MDLKTPTKKVEPFILDDRQKSYSPESDEEEQEEQSSEVEKYRKRYVGDVDLPEGVYTSRFHFFSSCLTHTIHRPRASLERIKAPFCFIPYSISRGMWADMYYMIFNTKL